MRSVLSHNQDNRIGVLKNTLHADAKRTFCFPFLEPYREVCVKRDGSLWHTEGDFQDTPSTIVPISTGNVYQKQQERGPLCASWFTASILTGKLSTIPVVRSFAVSRKKAVASSAVWKKRRRTGTGSVIAVLPWQYNTGGNGNRWKNSARKTDSPSGFWTESFPWSQSMIVGES